MAKNRFYDATKKQNRDETWRRWKGGQKLVDELTAFYTNKRVYDRLGMQTPLASSSAQPNSRQTMRANLMNMFLQGKGRGSPYRGLSMHQALTRQLSPDKVTPATQLPGRDAPKR